MRPLLLNFQTFPTQEGRSFFSFQKNCSLLWAQCAYMHKNTSYPIIMLLVEEPSAFLHLSTKTFKCAVHAANHFEDNDRILEHGLTPLDRVLEIRCTPSSLGGMGHSHLAGVTQGLWLLARLLY